ncbi:MAG: hypothetical protein GY778_21625 [bacterium]|nr:hypothetical protein [bacterium]
MSVRFVMGRAGAGKTDHCLEAVRQALVASPVDGPALILLVPEQAALQMERAVIDDPRLGAAHRAQVVGFRRLAYRILADAQSGGEPQTQPQALTANGRAMTLRLLVGRLSDRLQYYRRVERLSGFIDRLAHSIGELFDEAVTPDDLIDASTAAADDPLRSRKLADLGLIYQAYLDHLGDTKLDPSQYLETARWRIGDCPWLREADIWVDGFAGFTRQEMLTLVQLATVSRRVEVTGLIDPDEATVARPLDHAPDPESTGLFAKTVRTYLGLHRAFSDAGVEIKPPLLLRPDRPQRFRTNPQLAVLERRLFGETGAEVTPTSQEDRDESARSSAEPPVELVALPDRRVEVEYAVSRIFEWVQRPDDPLRYRDIALIVRDLEPYADLLSAALAERNIPFFIDRRRPTAHHPLVELLRSLVAMAADSMSSDSVRLALKTGLLGIADNAADELENFILAHAVAGFNVWTAGDWSPDVSDARISRLDETPADPSPAQQAQADRANATRTALLNRIAGWLEFARSAGRVDGRNWAKQLATTLAAKLDVGQELARWAEQAEQDGDLDAAEEHRQIWRDTTALLDDLADALADEPLSIGDLASVLEAGLSQFSLGLAPPMLDQVLVGAVQRSRHPNVKAAVILGFNDGAFPAGGSEDSVLTDDDRVFLADRGVTVGTPRRRQVLDERLLTYVALTRAGRHLVITHPRADAEGKPLRVSPFADDLRAACPGLHERAIGDPTQTRDPWPLMTSNDLAGALALEFQSRPDLVEDDHIVRAGWNALYEKARADEQLRPSLAPALSALGHVNDARLSDVSAARLTPGTLQASVSRLESFAACPFRHFAEYSLRLKPRRLAKLEPVDVGTLHHTILEDLIGRLVERGQPLGQLDDPAVLAHLQDSCDRVGIRPPLPGGATPARDAYLTRRSREDLARVTQAQRNVLSKGAFRPAGAEVAFGFQDRDPASLPALEIDTPAGRRVRLRGYIDRVDLAELADDMLGLAVDYKHYRQGKRLDLSQVYHGLSLQLLGYLLVLAQHGQSLAGRRVRPIGAFYVGLVPTYENLQHPDDYDEAKHSPLRAHRPRGLFDVQRVENLEADYDGRSSDAFSVRTKDGTIQYANRSDASYSDDFDRVLEHTRYRLGQLADRIIDGDVAVAPYRLGRSSPCGWCPFGRVCGFEFGQPGLRFLDKLSRTQAFDRLTRDRVEGAP